MTNNATGAIVRAVGAAEYLGLSISTLTKMRVRGDGPTFVRLGRRSVGYILDDLNTWRNDRRRRSTSDKGPVPLPVGDDWGNVPGNAMADTHSRHPAAIAQSGERFTATAHGASGQFEHLRAKLETSPDFLDILFGAVLDALATGLQSKGVFGKLMSRVHDAALTEVGAASDPLNCVEWADEYWHWLRRCITQEMRRIADELATAASDLT
jgi:predicted DNA-binding transcriptional regulator AlpA